MHHPLSNTRVQEHCAVRQSLDRPQTDPDHYRHRYNSKQRLASYWHQVNEVLNFRPSRVLEVGIGSGFVCGTLRREGVEVVTLDVDARLQPSITGSVRALPLRTNAVDVCLCCQVLEHLPFSELPNALRELRRVASSGLVISLPDQERYIRASLSTSSHHLFSILRDLPRPVHRRPTCTDPEHYWEIGCGEIGLAQVTEVFTRVIGKPVHTYRVWENPYHRFFIVHL